MIFRCIAVVTWLSAFAALGCTGAPDVASPAVEKLRSISVAYLNFAAARGTGPENERQLRAYLARLPSFVNRCNAATDGDPLVSNRDGQPFVIVYGQRLSTASTAPAIAYEQHGKDGRRWVAFANGQIECVEIASRVEAVRAGF